MTLDTTIITESDPTFTKTSMDCDSCGNEFNKITFKETSEFAECNVSLSNDCNTCSSQKIMQML